jgi:hypothetical protein
MVGAWASVFPGAALFSAENGTPCKGVFQESRPGTLPSFGIGIAIGFFGIDWRDTD